MSDPPAGVCQWGREDEELIVSPVPRCPPASQPTSGCLPDSGRQQLDSWLSMAYQLLAALFSLPCQLYSSVKRNDDTSLERCEFPKRQWALLCSSFCPAALPHSSLSVFYTLACVDTPGCRDRGPLSQCTLPCPKCLAPASPPERNFAKPLSPPRLTSPHRSWNHTHPCYSGAAWINALRGPQVLTSSSKVHPTGSHPAPACPDFAWFLLTGSRLGVQREPDHHESQQRGDDPHPGNHPSLSQGQTTPG